MSDVVPLHGARASETSPSETHEGTDDLQTRQVPAPAVLPERVTPVGSTMSRYVVLEEVGRGGMGRVLRAYDPKLQREVALKEVRGDALDETATERLVAEARAMAKLAHPHVVSVFDVEELATGEVVLVMEYVAGRTLRAWLRERKRSWREVVEQFVAAGRGLVAAHEAGLLHRDFKPANVLVAADGTVKVMDFGLAKLGGAASLGSPSQGPMSSVDGISLDDLVVEQSASESLTRAGLVMGTPRYMAPEQHRGEALTPAVDQYAFCVALWEALCGAPPFSGERAAKDKQAGPPRWPVASTPRSIADAIARGLAPRPEDRWPSLAALLEALAWDPSRRRRRWLVALGGVGVLGLAGVSYQAWAQARAQRCSGAQDQLVGIWDEARREQVEAAILGIDKSYAQQVWTRAQRELDAYAAGWIEMHTEACEATTVRGEQSPQMLDLRMGCLHRAVVDLRATVDTLAEADAGVVRKAHELTAGLRPLGRCADAEALAAEVEPPRPEEAEAVEAAREQLARAESLTRAGRYEEARQAVEAARAALAGVEYGPVQTEAALQLGNVLDALGRYEASEAALTEALRLGATWRQWDEMRGAATSLMSVVGVRQQRAEEGLRYRPLAEGLARGEPGAEVAWRSNLGSVLYAQGKYGEAEVEHRAALSLSESARGAEHPDTADSRNNLAIALAAQGEYGEAEAEFRAALSLREKALGPEHPDVASWRSNLGSVLTAQGKYGEAEAEHRAAVSLGENALGPEHPVVARSRGSLANALYAQGKHAEAEAEHRAALSLFEKVLGPEHPDVATSRNNLAVVLSEQGKHAEAEAEHRAALSLWEKALGPEHPHVAASRQTLAAVLFEIGRLAEALPLAERARSRREQGDVPVEQRAETAFLLARILWSVDGPARDRTRAARLGEDALHAYREAGEAYADKARKVATWLDAHPGRARADR